MYLCFPFPLPSTHTHIQICWLKAIFSLTELHEMTLWCTSDRIILEEVLESLTCCWDLSTTGTKRALSSYWIAFYAFTLPEAAKECGSECFLYTLWVAGMSEADIRHLSINKLVVHFLGCLTMHAVHRDFQHRCVCKHLELAFGTAL